MVGGEIKLNWITFNICSLICITWWRQTRFFYLKVLYVKKSRLLQKCMNVLFCPCYLLKICYLFGTEIWYCKRKWWMVPRSPLFHSDRENKWATILLKLKRYIQWIPDDQIVWLTFGNYFCTNNVFFIALLKFLETFTAYQHSLGYTAPDIWCLLNSDITNSRALTAVLMSKSNPLATRGHYPLATRGYLHID